MDQSTDISSNQLNPTSQLSAPAPINKNQIMSDDDVSKLVGNEPKSKQKIKIPKFNFPKANKNSIKNIGALLIIILVLAVVYSTYMIFLENDKEIVSVQVTNITANSATISWSTSLPETSRIIVSEDENISFFARFLPGKDALAFDDRETFPNEEGVYEYKREESEERFTHHVTFRNLDSSSIYYFAIAGDFKVFKDADWNFSTARSVAEISEPDPIYGQISINNSTEYPVSDGLIFFRVINESDVRDETQLYSSVINEEDSAWSADLSNLRSSNGSSYDFDSETHVIKGFIRSTTKDLESFTYSLEEYKPLPTINL